MAFIILPLKDVLLQLIDRPWPLPPVFGDTLQREVIPTSALVGACVAVVAVYKNIVFSKEALEKNFFRSLSNLSSLLMFPV